MPDAEGVHEGEWRGLVIPFDQPSVDGRIVRRPPGGAKVRPGERELKYQPVTSQGHDNALIGLAKIESTWETEDGLWASGTFDMADPAAAEVYRKVKEGYLGHVSADLFRVDARRLPDGTEEIVDWELSTVTLLADEALDGARIEALAGAGALTFRAATAPSVHVTYSARTAASRLAVIGDTDLPWAPRETEWDSSAARERMREACTDAEGALDPSCFSRGFLYRDDDAPPENVTAYKMPYADVIDGRLIAVFAAVSSAAGFLDRLDVDSDTRERIAARLRTLYASAATAFGDESIQPPPSIQSDSAPQEETMSDDTAEETQDHPGTELNADPHAAAVRSLEEVITSALESLARTLAELRADVQALAEPASPEQALAADTGEDSPEDTSASECCRGAQGCGGEAEAASVDDALTSVLEQAQSLLSDVRD